MNEGIILSLLQSVLLNQVVIMGGILAPGSELMRSQLTEQIKHTRDIIDKLDSLTPK